MARKPKSVYIQTQSGDKFFFDAVLEVSYQQSGSISEYAVEAGVNVTDHYTQNNDTISLNGSISAVKFLNGGEESTSLELFEKGITALKKSGELFSVSFSDNLEVLQNCLFNSIDMKRSSSTGRYAIDVSASIKQILVASRASIVATPTAAIEYLDVVTPKSKASGNAVAANKTESQQIVDLMIDLRKQGIYEIGVEDSVIGVLQ